MSFWLYQFVWTEVPSRKAKLYVAVIKSFYQRKPGRVKRSGSAESFNLLGFWMLSEMQYLQLFITSRQFENKDNSQFGEKNVKSDEILGTIKKNFPFPF